VSLVFKQFRGVSVTWDTDAVKGQSVSVQATRSDDFKEVKSVPNHGHVNVAFGAPGGKPVTSNIKVVGSRGGEESGTVTVS
jgi:hypothetical protein